MHAVLTDVGESESYKHFTMFIESEPRDDYCTMTECMIKLWEIPNSVIECQIVKCIFDKAISWTVVDSIIQIA